MSSRDDEDPPPTPEGPELPLPVPDGVMVEEDVESEVERGTGGYESLRRGL